MRPTYGSACLRTPPLSRSRFGGPVGERAASSPTSEQAVERRALGEKVADIATDLSSSAGRIRHVTTVGVPRLLTPWLQHVPTWRLGRERGYSAVELGSLYGVPAHLISLALDGWPSRSSELPEAEVIELWRAGHEVPDIAQLLYVSEAALRGWIRSGDIELTPERLTSAQIVARYGWSHNTIKMYRGRKAMPPPDSAPSKRGVWWWEDTILRMERDVLVHHCTECGARFDNSRGLTNHCSHIHPRQRPSEQ